MALIPHQQNQQIAEVIPLHPPKPETQPPKQENRKSSEDKWSKAVLDHGFSIIPALLLRAQQRIGLNPTQLAVLLHLADYWWDRDRKPFPSKKALSERLGLSERQVQRHIADLEAAGLVLRIERRAAHKGKISNEYDLSGLVERLKKLEPEFREVKEMKRQVSRKGGLGRRSQPAPSKP
jgi:DNA-binding transcriptional ArsR family regulator